MNHLREIQQQKLEELKQIIRKEDLQEYYNTHTYKETAQYYKDAYGCSVANLRSLYDYFEIAKKGKGYNLSQDREKVKQGMIDRYGEDNPQKVKQIREKTMQTTLERYGAEFTFQSDEIKEKIRQTHLENYGVENPFAAEEIKEKIKQTCLDRYGVEHISKSEQTINKVKQTKLARYGDSC